jgi:hypothetical protein
LGRHGSGLVAWSAACDATDNNCEAARGQLGSATVFIEPEIYEVVASLNMKAQTPAESLEVEE